MKNRKLIMDCLANTMAFVLMFNIFAFLYAWGNAAVPWLFLLAALPFAGLFVLRKNIKDLGIFIAAHIVILTVPMFAFWGAGLYSFVVIMMFMIAMVAYSVGSMLKGEWKIKTAAAIGSVAVFVIIFMIIDAVQETTQTQIYGISALLNITTLICLVAAILYIQMDNLDFNLKSFLSKYKKTGAAQKGIFAINNRLAGAFVGIIALVGAIAVLLGTDAMGLIIRGLRSIVTGIAQAIGMLMGLFMPEERADELQAVLPMVEGVTAEIPVPEGWEDEFFNLSEAIWQIISPIILFLMVVALLVVIVSIIIKLKRHMAKKAKKPIANTEETGDDINKLKFNIGDLAAFLPKIKINTKNPVRRAYIKKVNSHIKKGCAIGLQHTPEKIADKIRPTENIDELTAAYELARYGRNT